MSLVDYWNARYANGGHSGDGSRGESAQRKADYVNGLIRCEGIVSVVDWGCGEGQQLALLDIPDYLGIDVAPVAVARCLAQFGGSFLRLDPATSIDLQVSADLALSMDVIFHLVDDDDFASYMRRLFASARRFVCIHSTDYDAEPIGHMHHRAFTTALHDAAWDLVDRHPEPTEAGFYLYRRRA